MPAVVFPVLGSRSPSLHPARSFSPWRWGLVLHELWCAVGFVPGPMYDEGRIVVIEALVFRFGPVWAARGCRVPCSSSSSRLSSAGSPGRRRSWLQCGPLRTAGVDVRHVSRGPVEVNGREGRQTARKGGFRRIVSTYRRRCAVPVVRELLIRGPLQAARACRV